MSRRGVFVSGTDTGVGKTLVGCALVRALKQRGLDVGVMKPIETGVGGDGPLDAIALREAAGVADTLEEVCPQQFALPAAPTVAALHEERDVELALVFETFEKLAARHDWMLVEGAGGLLVPAAEGVTMADLARQLELPLLLVARAALGTINHTLLTLEAATARGLEVVGVVVSHSGGKLSLADEKNLDALRSELGDRLLGEVPPLAEGSQPDDSTIDVARLLARLD